MMGNNRVPEKTHRCGVSCLGPLSFHSRAVGDKVHLSCGGQLAERNPATFRNGLVFSSRSLNVREKVRLRIQNVLQNWSGSLRLGFTTVPPTSRTLPLPDMAIPHLTNTHGHWAAPVSEVLCGPGSELEFWVSAGGSVYFRSNNSRKHKLLVGLDLSKPLWAMIDIYGQTCSVFLLEYLTPPDVNHYHSLNDIPRVIQRLHDNKDEWISFTARESPSDGDTRMDCVVCMSEEATVTLICGHQCLCDHCISRFFQEFGTCPLCRQKI
ncbi:E3 ubiquitin-protein ligase NEURL3-like isoform X2 [Thalassophryne amazonica]|uniref:E3 ubiquitin-protein ligase NEURL3-like isoform X2 n=1 Tax=Thalassophryne amazonica TaxID=390379 RepID=UPI001470B1FB|nr:E3 ubiquitin-protein ligase NEURL3-like isoform X2 [Thalassophryne amazonica]